MKPLLIVLLITGVVACSKGGKETYQFYDTHAYASFIRQLQEQGVSFSETGNMTISYSSSQKASVMATVNSVMAYYYSDCSGNFRDARRQRVLKSRLKKNRIPYRTVMMDDGEKILCDEKYTERFNSVYRSVLRRYR